MSDRTEELYVGYLVPSAVVVGRLRRIAAVAFVLERFRAAAGASAGGT